VADASKTSQDRRALDIALYLVRYVWPKDDWNTRMRVVGAIGLLVGGKVCIKHYSIRQKGCVERVL
jgi:ABC transporter ATM